MSGIGEYPVVIDNGVLLLAEKPYSHTIVAIANNTAITNKTVTEYGLLGQFGDTSSTLAGIAVAANYEFYTFLDLIADSVGMHLTGPLTWFTFQHMPGYTSAQTASYCAPRFSDPRPEVLPWLNELLFRTGVYTGTHYDERYLQAHLDDGVRAHYNVTGRTVSSVNVYHSQFSYFAAAATVQLFTVLAIALTFWGWWKLGRNASFSPLEIAKGKSGIARPLYWMD